MTEIERSFLVGSDHPELGPGVEIRQAYLAIDDDTEVELRVRSRGDDYTLGIKGGHGRHRSEVELSIDRRTFDRLWALAGDRALTKTRHELLVGELTAEVDRFAGRHEGVMLVEVEFDDGDAAEAFTPPPWFGREVTDEPAWSNAELARAGVPPPGR